MGKTLLPSGLPWILPGILWILVLLVLPGLALASGSFLSQGEFGELSWPITLENYARVAGFGPLGWNPVYGEVLVRSVGMALGTTLGCILLAYPLAFFIARQAHPQWWLTIVILPFWTNLVVRAYAWMILFAPDAVPAQLAQGLGLIPPQTALYPSDFAVYIAMINTFLPYLVLPLYTSVTQLDPTLTAAAQDLYARPWQIFWYVILPQTLPGLASGCVLVSIPALGMFVIPDLLGGSKTILIGNVIQQQFGASLDYPFGSALSVVLTLLTLGALWGFSRLGRLR